MRCPECSHEPGPDSLLASPCPKCQYIWVDTQTYVKRIADEISDIATVLDIGCGNKGVIAQAYWEHERKISQGYACDIHVIKPLPEMWMPLKTDASDLRSRLGRRSVDFITHCGFLEHVEYKKAFSILRDIEMIANKCVFFTCSTLLREVNYKCKLDGNPHHAYRSFWDAKTFELLGYHTDRERMKGCGGQSCKEATFSEEVPAWYYPDELSEPWSMRRQRAVDHLCTRRCLHVHEDPEDGLPQAPCFNEPVIWSPYADGHACIEHFGGMVDSAHDGKKPPLERWRAREDFEETFPNPPWRKKWPCKTGGKR